jgi:hypothetical protein
VDGPGTIGSDGIYHAPSTPPQTNIAEVQATSLADPSKFDIAEVTIAVTPASVTFSQNPVGGGTSVTGTVTLSGNAPAGGASVTLASDNTNVATVPGSVNVAAATKTANFTITTYAVNAPANAKITATYNGGSAFNTLGVSPPGPLSLTLNPSTVWGTQPSTATLTLNANAPTGGMTVNLISSNTSVATVPPTVTVPQGANQTTFTVTTLNIASNGASTITALANGVLASAGLTVKAALPSTLSLNPTAVRGGKSATATITLTGPAPTGGLKLNLASSNTSAATVPLTYTVGAGKVSGTFTVKTYGVTSTQTPIISANARGVNLTQTLTVNVTVPKSITLPVSTVKGGTAVTATLNLDGLAPPGGLVVTLGSDKPGVATAPASVTVPAGLASTTFQVTTFVVGVNTTVKLSATANGTTVYKSFTVTP